MKIAESRITGLDMAHQYNGDDAPSTELVTITLQRVSIPVDAARGLAVGIVSVDDLASRSTDKRLVAEALHRSDKGHALANCQ